MDNVSDRTEDYQGTGFEMSKGELGQIFDSIDMNKNGVITAEDFVEFFKENSQRRITVQQASVFIEAGDLNKNGEIDFYEFVKSYRSGTLAEFMDEKNTGDDH